MYHCVSQYLFFEQSRIVFLSYNFCSNYYSFFKWGCFQVLALVAPAASGVATGNIYQSALSYSLSYGVKKATGKTIIENVMDINKQSRTKEKMVKQVRDGELVHSFYPRSYPQTFKSL